MSDSLDIPKENYTNLKNNYYVEVCDNLTHLALESDGLSMDMKIIYELNLLSLLLNMDAKSLNGSYKIFQDELEANPYSYDKDSVDFVENIYAKSLLMARKINKKQ